MPKYYIGERLVEDDEEGIPVLDESGEEFYVHPDEFDALGMPGADAFTWSPTELDKQAEEGEQ